MGDCPWRAVLNPLQFELNRTLAWDGTHQATAPADQPLRRDEELVGTETEDQIESEQGNDTIEADACDDTVDGGRTFDIVDVRQDNECPVRHKRT